MLKWANITGLEGLFNLNQQGIDIRPTLLRVITDQYLQTSVHTPDEERQFTELAMRLLDETEIATRAVVAKRLAPHSYAPRPIILQLARDVLEVAEPVLLQSPCLTPEDLSAIAAERGASCAQVIARRVMPQESKSADRPQATQPTAAALAAKPLHADTSSLPAATAPEPPAPPPGKNPQQAVPISAMSAEMPQPCCARPESPESLSAPPLRAEHEVARTSPAETHEPSDPAECTAAELCEQFFMADADQRRLILIVLDYSSSVPANPPPALRPVDVWQLEAAALQRNLESVASDLERSLGISKQLARRIIADDRGEPTVVAAKALAVPAIVLQRILLFMNPIVGQSVERVYKLALLYDAMTVEAAWRMIDIWQDADPTVARNPTHTAQWQSTASGARQALAETSRRTSPNKEPDAHPHRANGTDAR
jgi:hypothetical protein